MKKKLLFLFAMLGCGLSVAGQDITTNWPYLYPSFATGTVYFVNSSKSTLLVNIHVFKSTLHFTDTEEKIREANTNDIVLVEIGGDKYYSKGGQMMKVVASSEKGFIGLVQRVDVAALNNDNRGAYGASANSSAIDKVLTIHMAKQLGAVHTELKLSKDEGKSISLLKGYYIVTKGHVFEANKGELENILPESKKTELKDFLKKNKVKWSDPNSLLKVIDFVNM